jgi:hypothetical protein
MSKPAYILPEIIDPGAFQCVKIYLPADTLYYAAFWRAFQFFGTWKAWQSGDSVRDLAAAALWREAFDMSRAEWLEGDSCVNVKDVRQNEDAPCTLEKTFDEVTWEQFANLQLCPPVIQSSTEPGGPGFWWNPGCNGGAGCWEPIPLPDDQPDYDPAYDDPQTPIEDGFVEAGNDPECVYATNVVEAFKSVYERVDYGLYVGGLAVALWALLNTVVIMWFTKKARQLVMTIVSLATFSYNDWHNDYIGFDWQAMIDMIACVFNDDGTVNEGEFAEMLVKMSAETTPVWILTYAIAQLVGPVGFNTAADFAGITSATCTPDCDLALSLCYDLTADDGDFVNVGTYGHWTVGVGWVGDLNAGAGRYEIDVHNDTPPAGTIDYLRVEWNTTANPKVFQVFNGATMIFEQLGGNAGFRWANVTVGAALTDLRIRILQGTYNTTLLLTKVCFYRA